MVFPRRIPTHGYKPAPLSFGPLVSHLIAAASRAVSASQGKRQSSQCKPGPTESQYFTLEVHDPAGYGIWNLVLDILSSVNLSTQVSECDNQCHASVV